VAASGFAYFHKRYCIVNLQLKRDMRYCFAKFTVTIKLKQSFCRTIPPISPFNCKFTIH